MTDAGDKRDYLLTLASHRGMSSRHWWSQNWLPYETTGWYYWATKYTETLKLGPYISCSRDG
jgi:hypothetical protein